MTANRLEETEGLTLAQLRKEVERYAQRVENLRPETSRALVLAGTDDLWQLWWDAGSAVHKLREALREVA